MSRGGKIADPASSDAVQKIKTLASVTVVRCDVADPDSLAACLRGAQERQPVKGGLVQKRGRSIAHTGAGDV